MEKIVVLTGAGISAESGIKTFRDSNGLWENHRVEDVASPEGWSRNQNLVLDFYNQRRKQLLECQPNAAHTSLVKLEQQFDVTIITQNVDDLHERAGSKNIIHLHGELLKARSTGNENFVVEWRIDLTENDKCPQGYQLRPHIVWFGEAVTEIERCVSIVRQADIFIIIGTSLLVYPAAGLINYTTYNCQKFLIDPHISNLPRVPMLRTIEQAASTAVPELVEKLLHES